MAERCMDCPRDVTHTVKWHTYDQAWYACRFGAGGITRDRTIHRYCHWHAQVRAIQRNARGVLPAMQELRRLLAQQEKRA